jgi:hypothetical protein
VSFDVRQIQVTNMNDFFIKLNDYQGFIGFISLIWLIGGSLSAGLAARYIFKNGNIKDKFSLKPIYDGSVVNVGYALIRLQLSNTSTHPIAIFDFVWSYGDAKPPAFMHSIQHIKPTVNDQHHYILDPGENIFFDIKIDHVKCSASKVEDMISKQSTGILNLRSQILTDGWEVSKKHKIKA